MNSEVYTLDTDILSSLNFEDTSRGESKESSIKSILSSADTAIIPQSVYEELSHFDEAQKTIRKLDGDGYLQRRDVKSEIENLNKKNRTAVRNGVYYMRDKDERRAKDSTPQPGTGLSKIGSGDVSIATMVMCLLLTSRADTVTVVTDDNSLFEDVQYVVEEYCGMNPSRVSRLQTNDVY